MKREIKFRGKTKDGKWVYGSLVNDSTATSIYEKDKNRVTSIGIYLGSDVLPETVGQYTGLKDKNGVEIYEGDIYHQGDKNIKYKVIFKDGCFVGNQMGNKSLAGLGYWLDVIEIIGNIHDKN